MDTKLQNALEFITTYLSTQVVPNEIRTALKVVKKRLAEKHREQQHEADLVPDTVKYWKKRISNITALCLRSHRSATCSGALPRSTPFSYGGRTMTGLEASKSKPHRFWENRWGG